MSIRIRVVITITIDFRKSCYVLSTQIAITVIYTYNMFVLFCACDVMSVKGKWKFTTKKNIFKKKKNVDSDRHGNQWQSSLNSLVLHPHTCEV
jgi:hypothetical protein